MFTSKITLSGYNRTQSSQYRKGIKIVRNCWKNIYICYIYWLLEKYIYVLYILVVGKYICVIYLVECVSGLNIYVLYIGLNVLVGFHL